jgi:hypothetical protein
LSDVVVAFDRGLKNRRGKAQRRLRQARRSGVRRQKSPSRSWRATGDLYQRIETAGSATKHRSMIYGGGRAIAERMVVEGGATTIRYLYDDALGSIQTVASSTGTPSTPRDYALFGKSKHGTRLKRRPLRVHGSRRGP